MAFPKYKIRMYASVEKRSTSVIQFISQLGQDLSWDENLIEKPAMFCRLGNWAICSTYKDSHAESSFTVWASRHCQLHHLWSHPRREQIQSVEAGSVPAVLPMKTPYREQLHWLRKRTLSQLSCLWTHPTESSLTVWRSRHCLQLCLQEHMTVI